MTHQPQQSFRLDPKKFLKLWAHMNGKWRAALYSITFIIVWIFTVNKENLWIMATIALAWHSSVELIDIRFKILYDKPSKP